MSSNTRNIYEEHVKPLPRALQVELMDLLRDELENGDDHARPHSILELHGLGKEIWQGVDPNVKALRDEWEERVSISE